MWANLQRYYHTLKYLKPIQIYYRLFYWGRARWRRSLGIQRLSSRPGALPIPPQMSVGIAPAGHSFLGENKFRFLNLTKDFETGIDWDYPGYGKLWTYNLNYFEFLLQDDISKEQGLSLMKEFIAAAPALQNAWEPYPLSLRIIHWIKFISRHQLRDQLLSDSLRAQADALVDQREYHLLGNHLLENGFALLFAACYFSDQDYYRAASQILEPQLREQILPDGAHFELSPMYHQLMLWRVLDCCNLIEHNSGTWSELLPKLQSTARCMLSWLRHISFADGDIPLLNDAAPGVNPSTNTLLAYAERLSLHPQADLPLGASGYRKRTTPRLEILFDAGPPGPDYIPGHAHCDALSLLIRIDGEKFLVDRGVSTYEANAQRYEERSTSAHNTVSVAGQEQAEIWSSFRLGRRRKPILRHDTTDRLSAELRYAPANHWHRRDLRITAADGLLIQDEVDGPAQAFFHFPPNVLVEQTTTGIRAGTADLTFEGATNWELETYAYAAGFNLHEPARRAVVSFNNNLLTHLTLSKSSF